MADTGENPQRREQGPRREQTERQSAGAQTGGGRDVGTANSVGQNEKTNMMLQYRWNGVLECWWSTMGGGTEPGSIARSDGGDPEHRVVTIADGRR